MNSQATIVPAESTATQKPRTTVLPTARVYFVDVLRLIASFQMVNGHSLDAVMLQSARGGPFYDRYLWFRGLVSVSFLVVAGIAFHLSTLCRFEKHKNNPSAVRSRFKRAGFIILVGYFLRFPWSAFGSDPVKKEWALRYAQGIDVLHCIGFSLVFLETLTLLSKRPRYVVWMAGATGLLFLFLAPFSDALIADQRGNFLLNWISHQGGSPFPLFPWAGFVCAGLVIGAISFPEGGRTRFNRILQGLILFAIGTAFLSFLEGSWGSHFYNSDLHHPATNPFFSLEKLAAVTAFLVVLAILCKPIVQLPRFLSELSRETLAIYSIHLILLFYPGFALAKRFDHSLGIMTSFLVSGLMLILTAVSTLAWHRFKVARQKARRRNES